MLVDGVDKGHRVVIMTDLMWCLDLLVPIVVFLLLQGGKRLRLGKE